MSAKWQTATLGDIACNISRPFDFKNINSVVFVNTGDVLNGEFLHENKVDAKGLPGQAKKAIEKGDILYSEIRPGNKRYVLISKDNVESFVVSTKFMVIKATGPVSPEYLYLILTSRECEEEFKVIADSRSGTFPQITFDSVSYYPVRFPSAKLQKTVVAIDGAITKKIQLNHQINQTLEQIAQALFKSWFVDFDPVKAKIDVLEAGGSEEEALLAAMQVISSKNAEELAAFEVEKPEEYAELRMTAALFPAAMVESELGGIPEGWDIWTVKDFGTVVCGKTPPKKNADYYGGDIPFIKIPDTHGKIFITDTNESLTEAGSKSQIKKLIPENTVCVSCIATVGQVFITSKPSHTNQQINSLIPQSENYLYYLLLKFKSMNRYFQDLASGGSTTLNMNTRSFSNIELLKPADEMLFEFDRVVNGVMEKILANQKECTSLANLRDTLLPKLLSGELDVSELADSLEVEA